MLVGCVVHANSIGIKSSLGANQVVTPWLNPVANFGHDCSCNFLCIDIFHFNSMYRDIINCPSVCVIRNDLFSNIGFILINIFLFPTYAFHVDVNSFCNAEKSWIRITKKLNSRLVQSFYFLIFSLWRFIFIYHIILILKRFMQEHQHHYLAQIMRDKTLNYFTNKRHASITDLVWIIRHITSGPLWGCIQRINIMNYEPWFFKIYCQHLV